MKIEGFFSNIKTANEVVSKLKSEGYNQAFVDINEHYTNAYSERGFLGTEDISTLSEAVLGSGNNRGQSVNSPLAAASPMVSGMGGFEEIASINCKVVVDVGNKDDKAAKKIISDMGGELENLNPKIPKGLEKISVEELILGNVEE